MIPAGLLVIVPDPFPIADTVKALVPPPPTAKVAVKFCACVIVTTQSAVPLHPAPLHPMKTKPGLGKANNVTCEFCAKLNEHTGENGDPQLIPPGVLDTVPLPVGVIVTFSAKDVLVAVPDNGKLKLGFAGSFVVIASVAVKVPAVPAGGAKNTSTTPEPCGGTITVHGGVPPGAQLTPS